MPERSEFKVAIHLLELTQDRLEWPTGLGDFAGVRVFVTVNGQVIGHFDIWNSQRPLPLKQPVYDSYFSFWLPVAHYIFGNGSPDQLERLLGLKTLILEIIGWSQDQYETLLREQCDTTVTLPSLSGSMVLVTKDRPQDLSRALQYLHNHETDILYEIIVVDNNPDSGLTPAVTARFSEVIYVSERRPGTSYARNAGVLAARGDVVVLTDDDVVVGKNWLNQMIAPFTDPRVGAVMGLVLPYEFSTPAQYFFEESGGLGLGYQPIRFDQEFFSQKSLPNVARLGNGSTAAFRLSTFTDPKIGPFQDALGSGTAARGGGDVYQFYRVLAAGLDTIYNPKAYVFHKHRATMAKLRKQLVNFECGYAAMLTLIATRDKDPRAFEALSKNLPRYQLDRLRSGLDGIRPIPVHLTLLRIWGNLIGPFNLWRSLRQSGRLGANSYTQFAEQLARREPLGCNNPSKYQ